MNEEQTYIEAGDWLADRVDVVLFNGQPWDLAKYPIIAFMTGTETQSPQPAFINHVRMTDEGVLVTDEDPKDPEPIVYTTFGNVEIVWHDLEWSHGFYFRAMIFPGGTPHFYTIPEPWLAPPELRFDEQLYVENNLITGKEFEIECCTLTLNPDDQVSSVSLVPLLLIPPSSLLSSTNSYAG